MRLEVIFATGLLVLGVAVIAVAPWAYFWAINAIFGTGLVVTPKTWLAATLLAFAVNGGHRNKAK